MNHGHQLQDVCLTNKIEHDVNIHLFPLHALLNSIIIMCNNIHNKLDIVQLVRTSIKKGKFNPRQYVLGKP